MGDATPKTIAYVDESGNNDLETDKPGVSNLFILAAIIVDEKDQAAVESGVRAICSDLCGGKEIASKRIGSDAARRIKFLERMQELPFGYYGVVLNKSRIRSHQTGLQYKRSFYKFVNRKLYTRLSKTGNDLHVVADKIGSLDFMNSFEAYLADRMQLSLFDSTKLTHEFSSAELCPALGLADLIAGTLSYCYDKEKYHLTLRHLKSFCVKKKFRFPRILSTCNQLWRHPHQMKSLMNESTGQ